MIIFLNKNGRTEKLTTNQLSFIMVKFLSPIRTLNKSLNTKTFFQATFGPKTMKILQLAFSRKMILMKQMLSRFYVQGGLLIQKSYTVILFHHMEQKI